jgi:hypothetical protein
MLPVPALPGNVLACVASEVPPVICGWKEDMPPPDVPYPLFVEKALPPGNGALLPRGEPAVGFCGRSGRYIRMGTERTLYAVSRSCGGSEVALEVAGSVEGGREWVGLGEWNDDGDPTGGGGRGEGVILEATFQKSSKLSVERAD